MDEPHACVCTSLRQRLGHSVVHVLVTLPEALAQDAHAVDDHVDTVQMQAPGLGMHQGVKLQVQPGMGFGMRTGRPRRDLAARTATTSQPRASSARSTWPPMNPFAPSSNTRKRLGSRKGG